MIEDISFAPCKIAILTSIKTLGVNFDEDIWNEHANHICMKLLEVFRVLNGGLEPPFFEASKMPLNDYGASQEHIREIIFQRDLGRV